MPFPKKYLKHIFLFSFLGFLSAVFFPALAIALENEPVKIGFEMATGEVLEADGQADSHFTVIYDDNGNPNPPVVEVKVEIIGGTATQGLDYEYNTDIFIMDPNSSRSVDRNFNVKPDLLIEGDETMIFVLTTSTPDVEMAVDTFLFTIIDNDYAIVQFDSDGFTVNESDVSINFSVLSNFPVDGTVDMYTDGTSTAMEVEDYSLNFANAESIAFSSTSGILSYSFTINVKDDMLPEGSESFVLKLTNPTGSIQLGPDSVYTLIIKDNETPISSGLVADAINSGEEMEVDVVVQSSNMGSGSGDALFVVADSSGFMYVQMNTNSVEIGDRLLVQGSVVSNNGFQMFQASNMIAMGQGEIFPATQAMQAFTESDLNQRKKMDCAHFTDASTWNSDPHSSEIHGAYYIAQISNGTDAFTIRIDDNHPLFGTNAPSGTFEIEGFVGSDSEGEYFLFVEGDVTSKSNASFTYEELDEMGNWGFAADSTSDNYTWTIESSNYYTQIVNHQFQESQTTEIVLVAQKNGCNDTVRKTIDVTGLGLTDLALAHFKVFPNPAHSILTIQSTSPIENLLILDQTGRVLHEQETAGQKVKVDIQNLKAGLYYLTVITESGLETVVIEKAEE